MSETHATAPFPPAPSSRIEDYAMLGDCESAALVSRSGSIDWLCWPRFDSGACFAALLGTPANGRWLIAPTAPDPRVTRRYRGETMILETDFETSEGAVRITDFMPIHDGQSDLVRIVTGLRGRVDMKTEIILRFAYGNVVPWVSRMDDGRLRAIAGPDMMIIRSDVELHGVGRTTVGDFTVAVGEQVNFVISWGPSNLAPPKSADPNAALAATEQFWRNWAAQCSYKGEWRDPVMRSLLTLKALTYKSTGGIVAAPTTSLPEQVGGIRNWDYRYCWLRDATITLLALMHGGYYREAEEWRDWLVRAAAGSPSQVQIMYGLSGERFLWEWEVPWLPGYENSRPVRIGNAAHEQLQLDVFGEVMDALHQARIGGHPRQPRDLASPAGAHGAPRDDLDEARSRNLGNPRPGAALHPFQGHGLGRRRSRGEKHGDVQPLRSGRGVAGAPRSHPLRRLYVCLQRRGWRVCPGVWLEADRRRDARHSDRWISARVRSTSDRHRQGDREAPPGRWTRAPIRQRGHG